MTKNLGRSDREHPWDEELVRRFGGAARRVRGKRSAKWLSDATAQLGYRVSPTVISKLDSGHRGKVLTVAEMIVISAALKVHPAALLYPNLPDGRVDLLPGLETRSSTAAMHLGGEISITEVVDDDGRVSRLMDPMEVAMTVVAGSFSGGLDPDDAVLAHGDEEADRLTDALELTRERAALEEQLAEKMMDFARFQYSRSDGYSKQMRMAFDAQNEIYTKIREVERRMRKMGLTVDTRPPFGAAHGLGDEQEQTTAGVNDE